jgi:ABC-type multidrug transport system fused ATPase/permease subunit
MLVALATSPENSSSGYVSVILQLIQIDKFNLQTQFLLIGCLATFLLSLKSLLMVIVLRKNAYFLSRRSAELSKALLSKLLTSSLEELNTKSLQQSFYAVTEGVRNVISGVVARCVGLVGDVATLITIFIGLLVIDSSIALASLLIYGVIGLTLYLFQQNSAKKLNYNVEKKYGKPADAVGHSLGGRLVENSGAHGNIITYNKAIGLGDIGKTFKKNQLDIRTKRDIVSGLSGTQKHNVEIINQQKYSNSPAMQIINAHDVKNLSSFRKNYGKPNFIE